VRDFRSRWGDTYKQPQYLPQLSTQGGSHQKAKRGRRNDGPLPDRLMKKEEEEKGKEKRKREAKREKGAKTTCEERIWDDACASRDGEEKSQRRLGKQERPRTGGVS